MSKLKSLKDFRNSNLELDKTQLSNLRGGDNYLAEADAFGSETVQYNSTASSKGSDKERCSRQDNNQPNNPGWHCTLV
jgi:hypothetical protein